MTFAAIKHIAVDGQRLEATVRCSLWPDSDSHFSGVAPLTEFTLRAAIQSVGESNTATMYNAVQSKAWEFSDGGKDYYVNGSGVVQATPARPSEHMTWDWQSFTWADQRTLAQLREVKWEEIKTAREDYIGSGVATPYGTFDSKEKDRANITDAVLMLQTLTALGQPGTINFTLADNSTVTLTAGQMVEVGLLLGARVQEAHATARTLRQQIDAAGSPSAVAAVSWPS